VKIAVLPVRHPQIAPNCLAALTTSFAVVSLGAAFGELSQPMARLVNAATVTTLSQVSWGVHLSLGIVAVAR
jgi:hypothetical protein